MRRLLSHTAGLSMLSVPCFRADSAKPSPLDVSSGKAGDRGKVELTAAPGSDKVHATFWCFAAVDGGYLAR